MTTFLYLYGFVPADAPLPPEGLAGVAEGVVQLVPLDGFAAAVSAVSSVDFAPEALAERTRDLKWVGAHGLAHETVVAWFVDHAQILPVPVFTIFSSSSALAADASARRDWIAGMLRRFDGLREWDLKVAYTDEELVAHAAELSPDVAELDERIAAASPGTRFLLERKREEVVRGAVTRAARTIADELLALAGSIARNLRTLPLLRAEGPSAVVLNAAALVPIERENELLDTFARRAQELAPRGIAVLLSGPWAPYRFVGEEEPVA